jgi:hypothetical protein
MVGLRYFHLGAFFFISQNIKFWNIKNCEEALIKLSSAD